LTVEQGHHLEHLGRGAQFKDWEQVGQVVTQDVPGDRDRIFAATHALNCVLGGTLWRHDLNFQAVSVVVGQVGFDLLDDLRVVSALSVEPENCWGLSRTGTGHCEFDPVTDWNVFGLGRTPDVTGFDLVAHQHVTGRVDHLDGAVSFEDEGFVVRAVFFSFLRHQANVWHGTHGCWVVGAVCAAVFDDGLEDPSVGGVWDDGQGVLSFVVLIPHLAARTDHGWHGRINNDVGWDVQVGDPAVR